ncbi:MAG: putative lipid II flippase FtsW [Spirochaetaceae bacterium]|jgi:cell division protein FtsW|nr:putative lipid II flippase FtsW [Spirochaetaceae bacterium]
MKNTTVGGVSRRASFDHVFIAIVVLLTGMGLVTLYSASYAFAGRWYDNRIYLIIRQGIYAVVGLSFFIAACHVNIETLRKFITPVILGTLVFCVLPFFPVVGINLGGASRWIKIDDWTFQPSEIAKFSLPVYLAHILDKKQDKINDVREGLMAPVVVTLLFFIIIYLQNDFSTAIFIMINTLIIFFLAGIKMRYFISAAVMFVPISILLVITKEYRLLRVLAFLDSTFQPLEAGFQQDAAEKALRFGGFMGRGIGQGEWKISSVPAIQSDFIFASFAEETGFMGVIVFMLCFCIFAFRGYRIALRSNQMFHVLLCAGLVTSIILQMLMNISVVARLVPVTGVPLPFFSAGGSSLITTLMASGCIANISRICEKAKGAGGD